MDTPTDHSPMNDPGQTELLEGLAIHGNDFPRARQARQLVRSLLPDTEDYQADAFHLLVKAGHFSPHENLTLRRHLIPEQYPKEVLRELELVLEHREHTMAGSNRMDLRHLTALAIDEQDTIEIDDAVSAELTPDGGMALAVHIADVASLIPLHGDLDREASLRSTSVYLPEGKITMFPKELSLQAGSLLEGYTRGAITFLLQVDRSGEVTDFSITPSLVKVTRQMTYEQANHLLELIDGGGAEKEAGTGTTPDPAKPHHAPIRADTREAAPQLATLEAMDRAARLHRDKRFKAGALTVNLPETKIHLDAQGGPITITRTRTPSPSRQTVAEIMIMVCSQVAGFMAENQIPALYRSQKSTGETPSLTTPTHTMEVHHLYALLRTLGKASNSTTPAPHATLGLSSYVQVTSPLRRYTDLVMQRQLVAFLSGAPLPYTGPMLEEQSLQWEAGAASVTRAERETRRYWLLQYLAQFPDSKEPAIVLEALDMDMYRVELKNTGLQGTVQVGDPLNVGDRIEVIVTAADSRQNKLSLKSALP